MRFVFRADAGVVQGSGHVMRCLTIVEALTSAGHEAVFLSSVDGIPWLSEHLAALDLDIRPVTADSLALEEILALAPDRVVVDSYRIDAGAITALNERVPVLAVVDGDLRGIRASLYLDQNLGAEAIEWELPLGARMLAGASYALVRDAVLVARRAEPWRIDGAPRLLAVMGGTDPTGTIVEVARRLSSLPAQVRLAVVTPNAHRAATAEALAGRAGVELVAPAPDFAGLYATADIVVSAAGTSSWEVCTLGIPAVLIAVVDNQVAGVESMRQHGVVEGIDITRSVSELDRLIPVLEVLLGDQSRRRELSDKSQALFDGLGKERVVAALAGTAFGRLG